MVDVNAEPKLIHGGNRMQPPKRSKFSLLPLSILRAASELLTRVPS
jgi:hypothetical protein